MNIAIYTNSNIGIKIFKELNESHKIKLVITDNKLFSLFNKNLFSVPIFNYNKKENENLLKILNEYQIELAITASFGILPKKIWSYPKFGTINIHYSLLYSYAGPNPIEWQLHNKEEYTGITILFIGNKIDSGKIILQKKFKMPGSKADDVKEKLNIQMIPLLNEAILLIDQYKDNIENLQFINSQYKYSYYSFYKKSNF